MWLVTIYLLSHYNHSFKSQAPVKRVLGSISKTQPDGLTREITDLCYDVPLLDSLQSLLNNEDVHSQVGIYYFTHHNNNVIVHILGSKLTSPQRHGENWRLL